MAIAAQPIAGPRKKGLCLSAKTRSPKRVAQFLKAVNSRWMYNWNIGPPIILYLLALSSAALAVVTPIVPASVSGGTGTVSSIQSDDGISYSVAAKSAATIAGFTPVGGDISSVVLHVKFSVGAGGYTGTNAIRVNGMDTPIIPAAGDTQRAASVDLTAGVFRIDTWPEVSALLVTFANNDGGSSQALLIDHLYLEVTHSPALFAPPTWSDEFNDSGPPNPAVWTFEQGFVRNEELQWYQSNNAWQQNGNLIIEGRRQQVTNPNYVAGSTDWRKNRQFAQYTSSSIKSQGKYSFQYGRMQVRAKIPCFPGTWPAIWTLGNSGEWPSNGECDVLEYYATDSVLANLARGTNTRWSAAWDAVKKPLSPFFTATNPNPNWRTDYHIWTMQWDDQNIRLYIDNHLMNTTAQSWLVNPVTTWGPKEPFKQPHFLLLNLALGGAGGNPASTTFPLRYELDYVRVWEGLTGNNAPTDLALTNQTIPQGLPSGTVVGNLVATDVDAAEVHSFSLVSGTGATDNPSFEVVFKSDQTKTSVLRTKAVLNSADGTTRSIRVRVTDIEGLTYDKILTVQLAGQYVIEVAPATLTVPEGGNNTFNVRLRVPPTQPITVDVLRLDGDPDLSVTSPSQLTFTPTNGTVWQTVTLAAAEDADRTNGTATILCTDASSVFQSATVLANEADNEPPPIQAVVALSNLNQTFDGYMKSVTVTTTVNGVAQNLSYELTYGGQFMAPTDAGSYEIVATITDPDYVGSASGTLEIAKAGQTITFGALAPVLDNAAPFALTATASSDEPVSYTSSNPNVATLSGPYNNTVNIVGLGNTVITATQSGNGNYNAATPVPQTLTVGRANPLAVPNGPYTVESDLSLSLNGGASQPSYGATITAYSWDLNNDTLFGDVTGASPAPLDYTTLTTTWGMVNGLNTIALRVTDSAGKTSTVTTTVQVIVNLIWDSNGSAASQTDGPGDWTAANQWWDGSSNTHWTSNRDAIFGNSGTGGTVTLASPTTVKSLVFNSFTGTYTLGTANRTLTLTNGIIKNAGPGAATIVSPVTLGAAQTWTNHSTGLLTIGTAAVNNGGFLLSVAGTGNTTISAAIGGAGGLAKSGVGILNLTGSSNYAGTTTVSDGTLILSSANTISAGTSVAATGTLQLGHATALGTSTLALASGATLKLRNDASTVFTAPIATPSAAVTYHFDVNNAGGAATGRTLSRGNLTFANNTTNQINATGGNGYGLSLGTISSSISSATANTLTFNATTAPLTFASYAGGSWMQDLTFRGGNSITAAGNISAISNGSIKLTILEGTTVTLNGQANLPGTGNAATTLASGTLNVNHAAALGNKIGSASLWIGNGTTLNNTSGTAIASQTADPTITLGGNFAFGTVTSTSATNLNLGLGDVALGGSTRTITINGTAELTLGGVISNGGIIKAGTGTLSLGGQNTLSGPITVNSGTLAITATGRLTTSTAATAVTTVNSGGTLQVHAWQYGLNGSIGLPYFGTSTLIVNGGTIRYTGIGENSGNNNGRVFAIASNGATLDAAGSGTWFLTRNGAAPLDQTTVNGLTLAGSGNGHFSNVLAGSNGRLTKSGSGIWTLTGANTYTGTTTVSQGTLLVTSPGSLAAGSAVTVGTGSGGTLGGNGTIHGNVTVAADGSLAPGATLGTLTISGALDISAPANGGTGKLHFELGALANTNDRIAVTSALTIGVGALGFNDFVFTTPGGLQVTGGTPYTLITSGSITALNTLDPANLTGLLPGGLIGTLQINGNRIGLAVTGLNTAPTISDIANQSVPSGGSTGSHAILVSDNETDPGSLVVTHSSGNPTLVPNGNIVIGGSGANRTVTLTPVSGLSGTATITLTVTDGGNLTAQDTFLLTVTDNYLSWAASQVPPVTGGENGDSDNDGIENLVEYALVDGGERGVLNGYTITFTKRGAPYGTDLTYAIENSTLLTPGSWTTLEKPPVVENGVSISYTFIPSSPVENFARLKVVRLP